MTALKARVENGRLVLNEPTDLPEGTELELVPANEVDDRTPATAGAPTDEDQMAVANAIAEAELDIDARRVVTEEELWARLRAIG